jgi:outer membrane protein assembly factor BamD (BamD/ComL family)
VETKVELEYFEIEALIRQGQWQRAVEELEALYTTAEEHGLKNYKVKILSQLLQIYSKNSRLDNLRSTITRIS